MTPIKSRLAAAAACNHPARRDAVHKAPGRDMVDMLFATSRPKRPPVTDTPKVPTLPAPEVRSASPRDWRVLPGIIIGYTLGIFGAAQYANTGARDSKKTQRHVAAEG